MKTIDYNSLTDDEIVGLNSALFNKYVDINIDRWRRLPELPYSLEKELGFVKSSQCLEKAVEIHRETMCKLNLWMDTSFKLHISRDVIIRNFDLIRDYIKEEAMLLSLFYGLVLKKISDKIRITKSCYYTIIQYSGRFRLGFTKYEFMFLEDEFTAGKVSLSQLVECLNTVNKAMSKVIMRYAGGIDRAFRMTDYEKEVLSPIVQDADLIRRFSECYNRKNPLAEYVIVNIHDFILG